LILLHKKIDLICTKKNKKLIWYYLEVNEEENPWKKISKELYDSSDNVGRVEVVTVTRYNGGTCSLLFAFLSGLLPVCVIHIFYYVNLYIEDNYKFFTERAYLCDTHFL
jgi:hypothetical protein